MEKIFSSIRAFVDVGGKATRASCGNTATQEALFDVDGVMLIEKY